MTGSPPADQSTRFRKGTSGNPGGRPRKRVEEQPASAFDIVIDRRLTITAHGVERELTIDEALQQQTYKDALAGKRMAIRSVLQWIAKREAARPPPVQAPRSVELKVQHDPANADEALIILGVASERTDRDRHRDGRRDLLLEPWAVQRALSRRTGEKLTERDRDDIERCTRLPATLRWPRDRAR